MSVTDLIQAVKEGDVARAETLLEAGTDVNGHGEEQEWTPLNYASGRGDLDMVKLLVEKGADVFGVGRDRRTPYEIALAASRVEVAQWLREVEEKVDPERSRTSSRRAPKYCKAYYLRDLRAYPGWTENQVGGQKEDGGGADETAQPGPLLDDQVVFIHADHTVTLSMWHDEDILFAQVTPEWEAFCGKVLKFKVPDDLEMISQTRAASQD